MSVHALCRTCEEISRRLAELKTTQLQTNSSNDDPLASVTSSMGLEDSSQTVPLQKPNLSIKEKAMARMLQRLEELEKT